MSETFVVYNVQLGSSGEYRASDESAWLLLRETWQAGRLLNTQEVSRHATRLDALRAKIEAQGGPLRLRCERGQTVFDALEEAGVLYTRIGSWHSAPADNEVLVAEVKVHAGDPAIPVFYGE